MKVAAGSRLENIKNLKEKVIELQKELSFLERVERSKSKSLSPLMKYQSSKSKSPRVRSDIKEYQTHQTPQTVAPSPKNGSGFKNPTFWGTNPIIQKENQTKSPNSRHFKQARDHIRQMLGMTTRFVVKTEADVGRPLFNKTCMNLKGISPGTPKAVTTKFNPQDFHIEPPIEFERLALQKCQLMAGKPSQNTPRFKKISSIKTYHHQHIDPILQPPVQKKTHRKICATRNMSPQNMLTQHHKGNAQMYLSPTKTPIFLSPNSRVYKKNQSDIVRDLISYSTERLKKEPARGKKHFQKHFAQTMRNTYC